MEHLPLPAGAKHFIVAPYEAPTSAWYDNKGFLGFPARRNWTEVQLRGGDDRLKDDYLDEDGFKNKGTDQEVEQFFQTWLFFGLIIDVLKLGGVTACTEDFLKDRGKTKARIVDTCDLPSLLVKWEAGIKKKGNLHKTWNVLEEMFETVAGVLDRFCAEHDGDTMPLNQEKPRPWPVRDEISTTIIAVSFTLRRAAIKVCDVRVDGISPWPKVARSRILTRRLQSKACIAEVTTTMNQLPIDGHYYLAGYDGLDPEELDHHANCVKSHCMYDYDADMYVTTHTGAPYHKDCCREDITYGGQLGPERGQKDWVDAIQRIIDKDAIPIALWNKGWRNLWSVEYHFQGKRQPAYVAISHVWADSKGNPNANALPECQLDKIQRLVEKITWDGRKEVPSNPSLSDGVGFWMDTLCVPVADKTRKDKAIASMRHVYSHAKAVLVLDDWLQKIPSDAPPLEITARIYLSNWLKRLWTHQEGFLPDALWFQFSDRPVEIKDIKSRLQAYEKTLEAQGIHLGFPTSANSRLIDQYTFLEDGFKRLKNEDDKWILYAPLAMAMSERKTSRLADEIICLATIVDIPVEEFQKIDSKPDAYSGKERMARFLKRLGRFQTAVIFNNYDRLEARGYRWAPRSLLNMRTADLLPDDDSGDAESSFRPFHGQLGLLVHYHGFLIKFNHGKPSFAAVERGCAIQRTDTNDEWFIVQLPSENRAEWSTWETYAVILAQIPQPRARTSAVVAAVKAGPRDGVYTVLHESIATVWVQDTPPEWVDTVEADLLPRTTGWLVI
ncbi:hypothetical protein BJY04DRAFT_196396 [Aspergillus karnatakaensis]|uniref:uncharacterized protein n=1 Tax=Aspergillus karnatakaensis TaxID=1810916 RepID=UPI003CCE4244